MASLPFGAVATDTAEFMLGRVAVTPVFLESNGQLDHSTEDWTPTYKEQVFQNIVTGLDFWVDLLAKKSPVHTLEWVFDRTFVDNPAETVYEPISRISNDYNRWVPEFLTNIGFGNHGGLEANIRAFNHSQRVKLETDWSFTIFVVNAQNDPNGSFASGGAFSRAFAFAGGLFEVVPSTRPPSTFAHETGHIFYARDEYSGGGNYYQRRGYYDTQNTNAIDLHPDPNFEQEVSIMTSGALLEEAYTTLETTASTLAQLGWQDSDGDGIFDVLDVPLGLEGVGRFDPVHSVYRFNGRAYAQVAPNQNSSGNGNSITLNRVTDIQFRFEGDSNWTSVVQPNAYEASLNFEIPVAAGNAGKHVEIRAIDTRIGITSDTFNALIAGEPTGTNGIGVGGLVWNDANGNGIYEVTEQSRQGWVVELRSSTGAQLNLYRDIELNALPDGLLQSDFFGGMTIRNSGSSGNYTLGIGDGQKISGKVLKPFSAASNRLLDGWNSSQTLEISTSQSFTTFEIEAAAIAQTAIVQIRGYDAHGAVVVSNSQTLLVSAQPEKLRAVDPTGRMTKVLVQVLGSSAIELGSFDYGTPTTTLTDVNGRYHFDTLPVGEYAITVAPKHDIYQQTTPTGDAIYVSFQSEAALSGLNFGLHLAQNPWARETNQLDVDGDSKILPLDVLKVINALNRYGIGRLENLDVPAGWIVDANRDLVLSPLDVLIIVNALNANSRAAGEGPVAALLPVQSSAGASVNMQAAAAPAVMTNAAFAGTHVSWGVAEGEKQNELLEVMQPPRLDIRGPLVSKLSSSFGVTSDAEPVATKSPAVVDDILDIHVDRAMQSDLRNLF